MVFSIKPYIKPVFFPLFRIVSDVGFDVGKCDVVLYNNVIKAPLPCKFESHLVGIFADG